MALVGGGEENATGDRLGTRRGGGERFLTDTVPLGARLQVQVKGAPEF
jgi:hypothetical protein